MIRPLSDRVVIEDVTPPELSMGGIFVPRSARKRPQKGLVLAVGPGALDQETGARQALDVEVGDFVWFRRFQGHEFEVGGRRVRVLKAEDVLATYEEEDDDIEEES